VHDCCSTVLCIRCRGTVQRIPTVEDTLVASASSDREKRGGQTKSMQHDTYANIAIRSSVSSLKAQDDADVTVLSPVLVQHSKVR